jgi:hypothetical protein
MRNSERKHSNAVEVHSMADSETDMGCPWDACRSCGTNSRGNRHASFCNPLDTANVIDVLVGHENNRKFTWLEPRR